MSKLDTILIDRMVGDMGQIFTLRNADKSPNELYKLTEPKLNKAKQQIKDLMLELIGSEYDDLPNGADRTCARLLKNELRQKINEL